MADEEFEAESGRLFVCIEVPDYVRERVERLQRNHRRADGVRWVEPEKLHITLVFLGEVEEETQRELAKRLAKVRVEPFFLELGGVGVFPAKGRPQVLWGGVEKADPRLFQLHGKVEQVALDLGFEPDRRRYSPHVTLARCEPRGAGAVKSILKTEADFGTAPFQVEGFALYASQLTSLGARYRRILNFGF